MLCHVPRRRLLPPLTAALIVALAPFVVPVSTQAQSSAGKRTLEIADYAQWRTISGSQISDGGLRGLTLACGATTRCMSQRSTRTPRT